MKRLLLFMAAIVMLSSCSSNEKKAETLIKDYLSTRLNDFKSYEPVETKVDTLFDWPIWDDKIMELAKKLKTYEDNGNEYSEEAKQAQNVMYTWLLDLSSFGQSKYKEAARNFYKSSLLSFADKIEGYKIQKEIAELSSKKDLTKQIGWSVDHKFRSNNLAGAAVLDNYYFMTDMKFKNVTAAYSNEDIGTLETYSKLVVESIGMGRDSTFFDKIISDYESLTEEYKASLEKLK